jgi:RES domain-containing protein
LTRVHRVLRKLFSKRTLDGEGAYRFGGRWSSPGTRVAYTSEHVSLAMIEYFIHIDSSDSPPDVVLVSADIPDNVSRARIILRQLPSYWRDSPAPAELAAAGDSFVADLKTAILIVPSVLAPSESNWLINPRHPEFPRIRVHRPVDFQYDRRFFA